MAQRKRQADDEGIPAFDEETPDRPSDDDQETVLPGEEPLEARDRVTPLEQRNRETLKTRVAREVPDEVPDDVRPIPGRLVEEKTIDGLDVTGQLEAEETRDLTARTAEEEAIGYRDDEERQVDEPSTDEEAGRGADRGA